MTPIEEDNRCEECGQLPQLIEEASTNPVSLKHLSSDSTAPCVIESKTMYFTIELSEADLERTDLSPDDIIDTLEATIENHGINKTTARKLGIERDDWQKGDACPECGSRRIHGLYTGSRELHSENNDLEYEGETNWDETYIRYQCNNCWTTLDSNAPGDLME